jgi:uncharacterized damage-inducible protein DinB
VSSSIHSTDAGRLFIAETRKKLGAAHGKIVHCIEQLSDDQFNWRPFEQHNSLANILLHLCGNLRQWIISGVGGVPDVRNRVAEFSGRARYHKDELLKKLEQTVWESDEVLAKFDIAKLTDKRRVQAFDVTVMGAIFDTVSHFVGHSQEIIYVTRLQLGQKYQFKFVPTKEQGGE